MNLRAAAREIFDAALLSADVRPLVARALDAGEPPAARRLVVLGAGKASAAMAAAVEERLGDRVANGLVVVKDRHLVPTRRVELVEAGHPVPDERGMAAARRLRALAEQAGADDVVLFLGSGGGSALAPAPAPPITLAEKQELTRLLLAAGATIDELNAVRKHCSLLKGGQLARAAAPARVHALLLSDVIGDRPDVIASGPVAPDPSTFGEALAILDRFALRSRVAPSVRDRLEAGARGEIAETPKPYDPLFARVTSTLIGNNQIVVDAAAARAHRLRFAAHVLTRALTGEARLVAKDLVAHARAVAAGRGPVTPPACLIAAGETTVTVSGSGRGGRCQELALAAALEIDGMEGVTVLAAGTDGSDGPTEAAGAIVDGHSVEGARARGLDARAHLDDNDSHALLGALDDLVITGPTNTNLLDLYLVLVAGRR